MSFNKPTDSEQQSAVAYTWNNRPVDPKESEFLLHKEDLVILRPDREYAWLDVLIERSLRFFHCKTIEVDIDLFP
jgi:hypothetical protein